MSGIRARGSVFGVALLAVAMLAAACGGDDSPATGAGGDSSAASATETATPDKNADFDWVLPYGYSNLDPHKSVSADPWLRPLYDRLINYEWVDDRLELVGQLAKSFEVAADGLSITFDLREGVTFQDNTPFNAAAVKANIERALGPNSTVASNLKSITSVEVVNDYQVVFHLSAPDPGVLTALTQAESGSMISPAAISSGVDLSATAVGAGPFKLVSAQQNAQAVYERWDGYWAKDDIWIKRLTIHTIPDANAGYNGLRSGTFDGGFVTKPLDLEAQKQPGWSSQMLMATPYAAVLNLNKPPFDNIEMRRALSMMINRSEVEKQLLDGLGAPIFQGFPAPYLGHDPALDKDPYDPTKAKQLAQEAGVAGTTIKMLYINTSPLTEYAQVIQQALGDLGIKAELEGVTTSSARPSWRTGNYDMFLTGTQYNPEPAYAMVREFLSGDNLAPPPAELVTMADRARTAPYGTEEREKAYQEISKWLQENPIHVLLNQTRYTVAARPEVILPEKPMKNSIADVEFRKIGIKS